MPDNARAANLPQSICTFWLGDHWFGVDARLVRRVTTTPARTPIPLAPAVVWGYVNLRGQIHLALDLGVRFGISSRTNQQEALLVLRPAVADRLAIVADRIGRIVALGANDLDTSIANSLALHERIRRDGLAVGVVKLDEGLLTILDPTQLPRLLDGAPSIAERPLPTNSL